VICVNVFLCGKLGSKTSRRDLPEKLSGDGFGFKII
jgi:hypothetical protein